MRKCIFGLMFVAITTSLTAQEIILDANLKTRGEFRHGQGVLFEKSHKPGAFVNQRVRLGATFNKDWFTLRFAGQHIFTWGDVPQPQGELSNHFGTFEAWAGFRLDEHWGIKVGRQVLSYDDERILGALDWLQYGCFHDAALVRYANNGWNADVGLAFNQVGQPKTSNVYPIVAGGASYKTMQYLHLNKKWNGNTASFLFMNNGFQNLTLSGDTDGVSNMQTTGFYGKIPIADLILEASAYYQSGERQKQSVSAYQFRLEAAYQFRGITTALGAEILSGKNFDDTSSKRKDFVPLFGANHKFNGFMDLYYVASLQGTTGLNDFYAKVNVPFSGKSNFLFMPHIFTSNAKRSDNKSYLGTELDLVYTNKLHQDITLNVGYSHHFPSKAIKSNDTHSLQNWVYAELYIKPTLFSWKKASDEEY
ncbi:alginate export family protein [Capnocytophaga catalasegens]|nr:alginate export family protein [Capnocytophaga catalasegens]